MFSGNMKFLWLAAGAWLIGVSTLLYHDFIGNPVEERMRLCCEPARQIADLIAQSRSWNNLESVQKQRDLLTREAERVFEVVRELNQRETLLPALFPEGADPVARVRFAEAYHEAMKDLCRTLRADGPPTPAEIAEAGQDLAEREALRRETEEAVETASPKGKPRFGTRVTPESAENAQLYAQILKARRIACYATPTQFSREPLSILGAPPTIEQLWYAQLELWIQQDVARAVAALNAEAAKSGSVASGVERSPVKRICGVYVVGYQTAHGLAMISAPDTPWRDETRVIQPSFSRRVCDELTDVVVFELCLIVDQRDLINLVDRISDANLFQCTDIAIGAVATNDEQAGFLYGGEPAVVVRLEFEAYFLCEIYRPLMPAVVRERIGT